MVIFILTNGGFEEVKCLIKEQKVNVWVNKGVLSSSELKKLRNNGIKVTNFVYCIDVKNGDEIKESLQIIKEHHPEQKIWVES